MFPCQLFKFSVLCVAFIFMFRITGSCLCFFIYLGMQYCKSLQMCNNCADFIHSGEVNLKKIIIILFQVGKTNRIQPKLWHMSLHMPKTSEMCYITHVLYYKRFLRCLVYCISQFETLWNIFV